VAAVRHNGGKMFLVVGVKVARDAEVQKEVSRGKAVSGKLQVDVGSGVGVQEFLRMDRIAGGQDGEGINMGVVGSRTNRVGDKGGKKERLLGDMAFAVEYREVRLKTKLKVGGRKGNTAWQDNTGFAAIPPLPCAAINRDRQWLNSREESDCLETTSTLKPRLPSSFSCESKKLPEQSFPQKKSPHTYWESGSYGEEEQHRESAHKRSRVVYWSTYGGPHDSFNSRPRRPPELRGPHSPVITTVAPISDPQPGGTGSLTTTSDTIQRKEMRVDFLYWDSGENADKAEDGSTNWGELPQQPQQPQPGCEYGYEYGRRYEYGQGWYEYGQGYEHGDPPPPQEWSQSYLGSVSSSAPESSDGEDLAHKPDSPQPTFEFPKDDAWNCPKPGRRLSNEFELFASAHESYVYDLPYSESDECEEDDLSYSESDECEEDDLACYESDECDEYELELGEEVIGQDDVLW